MIRIDINSGNALELALDALSKGAVIVYPTDTIYGFGCDATNHEAINNLNNLINAKNIYQTLVGSDARSLIYQKYLLSENNSAKVEYLFLLEELYFYLHNLLYF